MIRRFWRRDAAMTALMPSVARTELRLRPQQTDSVKSPPSARTGSPGGRTTGCTGMWLKPEAELRLMSSMLSDELLDRPQQCLLLHTAPLLLSPLLSSRLRQRPMKLRLQLQSSPSTLSPRLLRRLRRVTTHPPTQPLPPPRLLRQALRWVRGQRAGRTLSRQRSVRSVRSVRRRRSRCKRSSSVLTRPHPSRPPTRPAPGSAAMPPRCRRGGGGRVGACAEGRVAALPL
jgi:hypothetical protein